MRDLGVQSQRALSGSQVSRLVRTSAQSRQRSHACPGYVVPMHHSQCLRAGKYADHPSQEWRRGRHGQCMQTRPRRPAVRHLQRRMGSFAWSVHRVYRRLVQPRAGSHHQCLGHHYLDSVLRGLLEPALGGSGQAAEPHRQEAQGVRVGEDSGCHEGDDGFLPGRRFVHHDVCGRLAAQLGRDACAGLVCDAARLLVAPRLDVHDERDLVHVPNDVLDAGACGGRGLPAAPALVRAPLPTRQGSAARHRQGDRGAVEEAAGEEGQARHRAQGD
mmetsp:Transcript_17601/g.36084  ORF Transcript_17601/g.36084 Transcript_17601/m.36084 type:complete len:273 (+) Transcript_17601:338-1156(+)